MNIHEYKRIHTNTHKTIRLGDAKKRLRDAQKIRRTQKKKDAKKRWLWDANK